MSKKNKLSVLQLPEYKLKVSIDVELVRIGASKYNSVLLYKNPPIFLDSFIGEKIGLTVKNENVLELNITRPTPYESTNSKIIDLDSLIEYLETLKNKK